MADKKKKGTVNSKKACQIAKGKKKLQTEKWGVKQQKAQNKIKKKKEQV